MKNTPLTGPQIRAGRALVRWRAQDLARESAVGIATIKRAELAAGETSMTVANDLAVRRALEAAGAEFVERGVRRRKLDEAEAAALRHDLHAIAMRSAERQVRLPGFTEDDLYDENGL